MSHDLEIVNGQASAKAEAGWVDEVAGEHEALYSLPP